MTLNRKDIFAAAIFILIGAAFALHAAFNLRIGTASRMGTGYFPLLLGAILAGLGLIIGATSIRGGNGTPAPIPWRAIIALTAAPVLFGLTARPLGLLPATVLCIAASTLASRKLRPLPAAAIVVGLTALSILVFSYGLRLPLELISSRLFN